MSQMLTPLTTSSPRPPPPLSPPPTSAPHRRHSGDHAGTLTLPSSSSSSSPSPHTHLIHAYITRLSHPHPRSPKNDNFALSAALKACSLLAELRLGRALHAHILKSSNTPDQVVYNALLSLYLHHSSPADALQLFDEMPQRNIVSWNSVISGIQKQGRFSESLEAFRRLQFEGNVGFSCATLTIVLAACSQLAALRSGKEVHAQIVRGRTPPDTILMNSLMDMYAKSGEVDECAKVFERMRERDLASWNVAMTAYAINGRAEDALGLFDGMVGAGVRPDGITFIAVLSSCSHAGLTEEGRGLFDRMEREFGVTPTVEHYACLVDLLGRAGRMRDALNVIERMPMRPGSSVWGSLLHSCRMHGEIELGAVVAERLFELEPENAGNYVMLSNMYASDKRWEEAKAVRERMQVREVKKEVGCSWIQIGRRINRFVAGGSVSFCNSAEYQRVWKELMEAMKDAGYVADTGVVLHDVDEGMKAMWVCGHSERIALVYGLIHSGEAMPVRIMKNLRVCLDCHNMMKIVSRVTRRLIVLRDTTRFHHFKDGACSCRDYW